MKTITIYYIDPKEGLRPIHTIKDEHDVYTVETSATSIRVMDNMLALFAGDIGKFYVIKE